MQVCHKCARWTCNKRCRSLGMVSINREDKINFIKDGLSEESLDDILLTLEAHPCGVVHRELLNLWHLFRMNNTTIVLGIDFKRPVCQFIRKLDGKHILTHRRQGRKESKVLGIIPKALIATNITGMAVGMEIQVSTMHERISKMLEKSDAFIMVAMVL
ncbi:hypothetical protein FNV43_RR00487 [Rhamnella rubrinervis]|uniref:Uncharacterized protein n=1 Tax=Rhamnella rubrinervis TaxID=2594499 RepID=A0A8K0HNR4_9ROSA|nr:hypothetical protein FNV43_RR00487 [Rhamnella rubrinervis]